jgi:hypothetical protein
VRRDLNVFDLAPEFVERRAGARVSLQGLYIFPFLAEHDGIGPDFVIESGVG